MKIEDISKSKIVRQVIIGICIMIVALCILFLGINIGEHRARYAGQFGNNFERNFMGPDGMRGGMFGDGLPGGHGAAGEIVSINLPQLIISGPDSIEKVVALKDSTIVREFQNNIKSSDLKVGDFVVVLGNPNEQGEIEAKLVRVMPNPMVSTSTSANPRTSQ